MLLLADMLFRRASARRTDRQDAPTPRPRAKTGRSPRARLHDEAWSLLP
jgi:hypothetical protein